jgi:ribonucleoside-diphosphate reductase alpha chain
MELNIKVIKRSGVEENVAICKIKDVISWACKDLDVNPLELESKVDDFIKDGITTVEIHNNIIYHAQAIASAEKPDWVYVAGRLNTMKRWKDTGAYEKDFVTYISDMKEVGLYTHPILDTYTTAELIMLGNHIVPSKDLAHSYGSTLTAEKKYLLTGETIQTMFMAEAMIIFGERYSGKERIEKVKELYDNLSDRKISLATPWLSNLRSNGNISSCFIISVGDDIENITESWAKSAKISKMGGGLGVYVGNLRAKGSSVAGRKNAAKSVSAPIKVFNDIATYVDQGGRRAGAFTTALPIWHNDIEEFLEIQAETGDIRNKAYDIFPQVTTPNLFWETDEAKGMWYTFCPAESKRKGLDLNGCYGEKFNRRYNEMVKLGKAGELDIFGQVAARDLVKKIMRTQFETGLPYIAYVDKINEDNPNKHEGFIPCTNLCTESFSVVDTENYSHTCNLASVVVGRCEDYGSLSKTAELLTEVLDAGIELTSPPTECSSAHNNHFRTIGVGVQGLHDWFAKEWKTYLDTEEATKVAEYIQYGCVKKSIELAKDYGNYPAFKGSEWDNGEMFRKFKERSVTDLDWNYLEEQCKLYGIRNSQMTSPAPNTSTSVFMDAAAGVPPVYSAFFREDNDNGKYPISCMHLKENPLAYSMSFRTYDQAQLTATIGAMQKFVDTGISAEYLLDQNKEDFSAKSLYDILTGSWKNGCKAVYYVRSIKKGETVDDLLGIKEEGCAGCAG